MASTTFETSNPKDAIVNANSSSMLKVPLGALIYVGRSQSNLGGLYVRDSWGIQTLIALANVTVSRNSDGDVVVQNGTGVNLEVTY